MVVRWSVSPNNPHMSALPNKSLNKRLLSGEQGASGWGRSAFLPWSLPRPLPPLRCLCSVSYSTGFFYFHKVPSCLWHDSQPIRPNSFLLTYILKSSDAFQRSGMDCSFVHLHGVVPEVATILSYPQNGSCNWVTTTKAGDKLLCFTALTRPAQRCRSFLQH